MPHPAAAPIQTTSQNQSQQQHVSYRHYQDSSVGLISVAEYSNGFSDPRDQISWTVGRLQALQGPDYSP